METAIVTNLPLQEVFNNPKNETITSIPKEITEYVVDKLPSVNMAELVAERKEVKYEDLVQERVKRCLYGLAFILTFVVSYFNLFTMDDAVSVYNYAIGEVNDVILAILSIIGV